MTQSRSPSRQQTDSSNGDGQPSTACHGGIRTPRRVQWASRDDVRLSIDPETLSHLSVHALDELGLDPEAFENLRSALERHKSGSVSARDGAAHEMDPSRSQLESVLLTQRLPSRPALPPQSSVTSTTSNSRHDQNPFSNPVPSHRFSPLSSTDIDRPLNVETPSTDTGANTPESDAPLLVQSTHKVPGEVWIDPNEREGLPVGPTPLGLTLGIDVGGTDSNRDSSTGMTRRSALLGSLRRSNDADLGRRFSTRNSAAVVNPAMERHAERLAVHRAAGVVRAHTRRRENWVHRPQPGKHIVCERGEDDGVGTDADRTEKDAEKRMQNGGSRLDHPDLKDDAEAEWTDVDQSHPEPKTLCHADRDRNRMRRKIPSWFRSFANRCSHSGTSTHFDRIDPEANTASSMHALHPHPRLGNGVLSALLTLYGHDHDHDHEREGEHDDEGSTSGGSTPGRRSRSSSVAGSEDEVSKLEEPERPWLDRPEGKVSTSSRGGTSKPSRLTKPVGRSLKTSSASSLLHALHHRTQSLPTSSSTAALIAGAGALTGAAVPSGATLAPDLRRGEGLVRYEIDGGATDATGERETGSPDTVVPPPASAETSQASSCSQTNTSISPASTGSETRAGSRGINRGWKAVLRDLPLPSTGVVGDVLKGVSRSLPGTPGGLGSLGWAASSENMTPWSSGDATPHSIGGDGTSETGTPVEWLKEEGRKDYFGEKWEEAPREKKKGREMEMENKNRGEKERKKQERREKRKREKEKRQKRKKAEVWITRHVAAILQRQEFILKLARAMMMFGGPSHRFVAQIQSTARVLDLDLSCMYLPDVMLISFEDRATGTSNVKFIRQTSALDLEKLSDAHTLYWNVIHDNISVSQASAALDVLMQKKPLYNFAQLVFIGAMCSASICSVSFSGSFIDCLVSAPLGGLLVAIQLLSPRNELYGNVFEITISTLMSFVSAALASTKHFCYPAVTSSSVVLILPGFIVLCGSLEICSRSLVAGAVRLCFALMYSLFLGFGLGIGAQLYESFVGKQLVGATDYLCLESHDPSGPWWQQTPSLWWAFLTVPMYSLFLSMRLMAPWWRRELLVSIIISCMGWVTNHFTSLKFPNQGDISAAVGAFVVGFVSNLYGRFFEGNAFVVMITGILFQVPSGLGSSGLLNFVYDQASGSSSSYQSGFETALQLISVAIGLTVGLGISLVVVHPIQSRRRAGGLFSL
ncbi:hypothetical protein BKA82DRAFT_4178224 [Pisolithus tinctorius]|nr:hypothetical protein BKA82DRAFT_4178224 [Pisolithus tinctorius]